MRAVITLIAVLLSLRLTAEAQSLDALFASEWEYQMQQSPTAASWNGDRRFNDRWEDISLPAIEARHQYDLDLLAKLKTYDRNTLSPRDRVNYDLFRQGVERRLAEYPFAWYLVPLHQLHGLQLQNELADSLRFTTVKDYEDWIARLNAFRTYTDQTIALLKEGVRTHRVQPKIIVERVEGQVARQIVDNPEQSTFYAPFQHFPASISPADQDRLKSAAYKAIQTSILPSFKTFQSYLKDEYYPAAYNAPGIYQAPQGKEFYATLVRSFTTTNYTPEQIHEIGLREVARIHAEMEAIKQKTGFKGSLPEFFTFLRTDPRFYFKDPQELFNAYAVTAKRIDPELVRIFKTLPRTPYGVRAIPATSAPDQTTAYYRPLAADFSRAGTYFVNLYKPETRPKWEMMALTLHESVPGHHLQIALATEQGSVPEFRRHSQYTAFVEGWGLYAESLGEDLALYDDPYSKFGQLTYEMWRAVRLVVDTGMHYYGWSREKAIKYFMDNAAKNELDVTNEIDRYIAWPGQALAYKVGELKIKELRARATRELGPRFDLREFHDVVLSQGAIPLDVLELQVSDWIAKVKSTPAVK